MNTTKLPLITITIRKTEYGVMLATAHVVPSEVGGGTDQKIIDIIADAMLGDDAKNANDALKIATILHYFSLALPAVAVDKDIWLRKGTDPAS